MKHAVFIERDGVLNQIRLERQQAVSPTTLEDFRINTNAAPLLKQLRETGLVVIATTNQPGLSHGYQSRRELDRMHDRLKAVLELDDIFVCPHDANDRCPCRKPNPGLLIEAAYKYHLDMDRCFVISDKWQDAEAARSAGCTSLLIESAWIGRVHRDFLMPSLEAAVKKILNLCHTAAAV